jgi:hypothetical protein
MNTEYVRVMVVMLASSVVDDHVMVSMLASSVVDGRVTSSSTTLEASIRTTT